jgi:FkbM family methyltransferase
MNRLERLVDERDPWLSVRLRVLKMRLRHDIVGPLMRQMLRPGEVGVDVGANRGAYTYVMSVRVGGAGHVHAIEPFPENSARLRTIARHRGNITVHSLAVSDCSGSGVLRIPVHQGRHIHELASLEPRESPDEDRCAVSLSTLDQLLAQERRVSLLKCDVEGHEQRVFEGATRILDHDKPVIIVEVEQRHREDPIEKTFAFFADAGYHGWFIAEDGLHPLEEFSIVRHQLDFLDGRRYVPYGMPRAYVHDFLFCPPGTAPPPGSHRGRSGATYQSQ